MNGEYFSPFFFLRSFSGYLIVNRVNFSSKSSATKRRNKKWLKPENDQFERFFVFPIFRLNEVD